MVEKFLLCLKNDCSMGLGGGEKANSLGMKKEFMKGE